jgi:hypothetical protein
MQRYVVERVVPKIPKDCVAVIFSTKQSKSFFRILSPLHRNTLLLSQQDYNFMKREELDMSRQIQKSLVRNSAKDQNQKVV